MAKWKRIDESKCELEGPYECSNCGGHIMIDATYLDQVDTYVCCPYCSRPGWSQIKPSPGALSAAEIIMNGQEKIITKFGAKSNKGVAELIDDCTAVKELLSALKNLTDSRKNHRIPYQHEIQACHIAISKAEGKG